MSGKEDAFWLSAGSDVPVVLVIYTEPDTHI